MAETITLQALDLSGETLTLFLRKSDGTLLNTNGDAMTESGSTGVFTATLAESRSGLGPLAVRVCAGAETADNLLYDGFLVEGSAVIDSTVAAELDSASIDAIWNEVLTGATHNIASSAGRRLRQLADTVVLVDGVCDAASNAGTDSTGTITLEVGTTTACIGQAIRCANQVRFIAAYDAGTRIAQLDRPWCVVPDAGDEYVIFNVRNPLVGLASLALAGSTAAVVNDINAVTEKVDTGLVLDGAVYQFTANMLELGPSGGGGGGDASQATLLEVKAKTDLIGTTSGISSLLAASVLTPGTITEFPDTVTIGDSYTVANGRSILIPIVDTDGNQLSSTGSLDFADAVATFVIKRAKETDPTRIITGTASFTDPIGTGTSGAPYAVIQLSSSETAKGLIGYKYSGVLTFTWPYVGTGTDPEVMSFETDTIIFDN
jgi:hypothetical protein